MVNNINNLDSPNKYLQGSIWKCRNNAEQKTGVQSYDRPVLIISNNNFNSWNECTKISVVSVSALP